MVVDWYRSLAEATQSKYFEPSDWQAARFVAHTMDRYVPGSRPSSQMFTALMSAMSDLLVIGVHASPLRIEIERGPAQGKASVSAIEE